MAATSPVTATPISVLTSHDRAHRRALALLFAVYLVLLVWLVLWKLHVPFLGRDDMRGIKLVPFVSSSRFGASAAGEVLANLLVFVPLGSYLGLLAPAGRRWQVAAAACGVSLALEVTQYVTAVGSSDVTDVLVNTTGAVVGLALIRALRRRIGSRTAPVMSWVFAVGTVSALVVAAAIITSFPALPPPT